MIIQSPSPNFDSRKGYNPDVIIIHCTDGVWPQDKAWLMNPATEVSSHYIISPTGEIHQLVSDEKRAWHAGRIVRPTASLPSTKINPNQYTIGIEVSLRPPEVMSSEQEESLLRLIKDLGGKHNIPLTRDYIWGHNEIRADKTCPGTINVDKIVKSLQRVDDKEEIKLQIIELLNKL